MIAYLPIATFILNLLVLGIVGLAKWGMTQREKAQAAVIQALTDRLASLENQEKERKDMCARHYRELTDLRGKTLEVEGYMKRTTEDFTRALEQLEKVTDRINRMSENMLTKQDLQIIIDFSNSNRSSSNKN
jgi:uncharacterized protein YpuA (DUF1002 family)